MRAEADTAMTAPAKQHTAQPERITPSLSIFQRHIFISFRLAMSSTARGARATCHHFDMPRARRRRGRPKQL